MGLTPLEGLVMGTRSGDIDPALHFFMMRETGMSADELEKSLNSQSGLPMEKKLEKGAVHVRLSLTAAAP